MLCGTTALMVWNHSERDGQGEFAVWIGRNKRRLQMQRGISISILLIALLFLICAIYQYVACQGSGYTVFKGGVATALGCVMTYFSKKW